MKRVTLTFFAIIIALMSLGVAGAQGPDAPPDGDRIQRPGGQQGVVLEVVADITGLTQEEILRQMREDGKTLADIITENGGDVEAAKAQIKQALTNTFNENVDQAIDDMLTRPFPQGDRQGGQGNRDDRPGGEAGLPRELVQAISEATGLDAASVLEQWRGGATLAEIATSNGADPAAIVATVISMAQERLDTAVANGRITREEADAQLAKLNEGLNKAMSMTRTQVRAEGLVMPALLQAVADELDMRPRDLLAQIEEGQTPADFITAIGGDVAAVQAAAVANIQTVLSTAVENGRLTQAEADEILGLVGALVSEKLNSPFERPPQRDRRPSPGGQRPPNPDGQGPQNQGD